MVVSIMKSLLVVWLSQLTITGGRVLHECLADGQQDSIIICPPEEVISSVEVAFLSDPNFSDGQCKPTCEPTYYGPPDWCNGEHLCIVDFYDEYCDEGEDVNVVRVTYHCSKVFEGCRADGEQGSFGCPPQHVIKIRSAKVGFVSDPYQCWLTDDDCSWSISRSHHLINCDEQQWCHLAPEVYNSTNTNSCRHRQHERSVIKIIYDCINYESEGVDAGAVAGITVGFVLLLLLLIVFAIIIVCLYRRLASHKDISAGNSHHENGPSTYEMPTLENSEYGQYVTVQSEASAPAQFANASTPSAPPPRSSRHDTTLVDNDLYQ